MHSYNGQCNKNVVSWSLHSHLSFCVYPKTVQTFRMDLDSISPIKNWFLPSPNTFFLELFLYFFSFFFSSEYQNENWRKQQQNSWKGRHHCCSKPQVTILMQLLKYFTEEIDYIFHKAFSTEGVVTGRWESLYSTLHNRSSAQLTLFRWSPFLFSLCPSRLHVAVFFFLCFPSKSCFRSSKFICFFASSHWLTKHYHGDMWCGLHYDLQ